MFKIISKYFVLFLNYVHGFVLLLHIHKRIRDNDHLYLKRENVPSFCISNILDFRLINSFFFHGHGILFASASTYVYILTKCSKIRSVMKWWSRCISMAIAKTASRNVAFKVAKMRDSIMEDQDELIMRTIYHISYI